MTDKLNIKVQNNSHDLTKVIELFGELQKIKSVLNGILESSVLKTTLDIEYESFEIHQAYSSSYYMIEDVTFKFLCSLVVDSINSLRDPIIYDYFLGNSPSDNTLDVIRFEQDYQELTKELKDAEDSVQVIDITDIATLKEMLQRLMNATLSTKVSLQKLDYVYYKSELSLIGRKTKFHALYPPAAESIMNMENAVIMLIETLENIMESTDYNSPLES